MKSEHRHELAQNDLEVALNKSREKFREIAEVHGNRILLWLSALLLLIAAVVYAMRTSQATNADGWAALMGAQNAQELAGIAESYDGTPIGDLAQLKSAEQYLQTGVQLMFTDRDAALTELDEAKTIFEKVLNQSSTLPIVKDRALFGLACTLETTSKGDFTEAIAAYEKLLNESPESPFKEIAEARVKDLKRSNATQFYTWFAEQKPKPQDLEQPKDLLPQMPEMPAPSGTSSETPEGTSSANPTLSVPGAPDFPPVMAAPSGTSTPAKAPEMPAPEGTTATPPATTETPAPAGTSTPAPEATSDGQ